MKRVAIQGFAGCFHEQAARDFYQRTEGSVPEIIECSTFEEQYQKLAAGQADA